MKTKGNRSIALSLLCLLIATVGYGQPQHTPDVAYTDDLTCGRPGHSSTLTTGAAGGQMQNTMGGVEVYNNTHIVCQNINALSTNGNDIRVCKKDATTGAPIGVVQEFNLANWVGGAIPSDDMTRGTALDAANNRIYICGTSTHAGYKGFLLCLNATTLNPVLSFGFNGFVSLSSSEDATGVIMKGSNPVVSLNTSTGGFRLVEINTVGNQVASGSIYGAASKNMTSRDAIKKGPNGNYFIAGHTRDWQNFKVPMIWEFNASYGYVNSTPPFGAGMGNGEFTDFDFYIDPTPVYPPNYAFDIIAVGNRGTQGQGTGIYAKYIVPANAPSNLVLDPSFTNQSTYPGRALATNSVSNEIHFSRCLVNDDGYITVLGWDEYQNSYGPGLMGYLTPNGKQYTTTYKAPTPTTCSAKPLHKTTELVDDGLGNFIISGCEVAYSYTTLKLKSSGGCNSFIKLGKQTSYQSCSGSWAAITINTPVNNHLKVNTSNGSPVYSGIGSIALSVYPQVTTTYIITSVDPITGCENQIEHTIIVYPNDPTFSYTANTVNSSYFTLSATPNNQNTSPGFGYLWVVEEIDAFGNVVFTVTNPSCWWIPLTTPTVFNGLDCVNNSLSGTVTISNCSTPSVGLFEYGKKYRITRGVWSNNCSWKQASVILEISGPGNKPVLVESTGIDTPDFSSRRVSLGSENTINMNVYPNPSTGSFKVSTTHPMIEDIVIINLQGQIIKTVHSSKTTEVNVQCDDLAPGTYWVETTINGERQIVKLIIL